MTPDPERVAAFFMALPKNPREALWWRVRRWGRWSYWRQVGPMYRVTLWWLNRD